MRGFRSARGSARASGFLPLATSDRPSSLQWQDLDLDLGTVSLDKNKTDDPRAWALSDGMPEALRAWRKISPAENKGPTGYVFVDDLGRPISSSNLAERFRGHLKTAGIKRDLLFKSSDERKQIVLHDLRATMITLNLAHGKNEAWIMDRTGHKSSTQIQAYRREVGLATARKLPALRPLNEAIPELAGSKGEHSPKPPKPDPQAPPRGTGKASPVRAAKTRANGAASAIAPTDDRGAIEAVGPDSGTRLRDPASNTASQLVPLEPLGRRGGDALEAASSARLETQYISHLSAKKAGTPSSR